jgi:acyl-CoA thioesterase
MSQFARDTAVEQVAHNLWRGDLREGWRIGAVPNGGYVLAVAGRVLAEALAHRDPLSVNAFYLAPTAPGPIDCHVDVLRRGRNTTHACLQMFQQGELKVQVTAAYTDLAAQQGASWSARPRPEFPPWEECTPSGQDNVEFFRERVEIRLVSGVEVFSRREPNGSGEFCGWIRHRDCAAPDAISLLMFADAFAPPAFTIFGPLHWVPTIELTVQVRATPTPGPLQARFYSRHLTRGIVEEDGEFWDSAGDLVAISRQTAKLRLPDAKQQLR